MAAPADMTTLDISGEYVMNKAQSDPHDEILRLQGISWLTRNVIKLATITLYVKHYKDAEGIEHIDVQSVGTGGFKGNKEERTFDWQPREVSDPLFGPVVGKSRRTKIEAVDKEWLKEGWTQDTIEHDAVESYVESDTPKSGTSWVGHQIWGFAEIEGVRKHVRRVHFTGPKGEEITARLVYDYHPTPLLNRSINRGRLSLHLNLENIFLRITRPFTSPWLLLLLCAGYIVSFAFFTRAQYYLTPSASLISCTATYWLANDQCGLNGQSCIPTNTSAFDFRCPAQCKDVTLANPRTIGAGQLDHVPLIVGGGDGNKTYRGDSFICAAAVQAGIIDDHKGGCGTLQLVSNFTDFLPLSSNGLTSIGFPSVFPVSFQLDPNESLSHCTDMRNAGLAFNILALFALFLILRPKPIILFWSLVCVGFWHVTIFSQPQDFPPPLDVAFSIFLPVLFISYGLWRLAFRFVLPAFSKAPIERAVWYIGPFWVGVLWNIVTAHIPLDRLTSSDIKGRNGALTVVIIGSIVVLIVIVNQLRIARKTGWLPHYFGWYVVGGLTALVLSQLPGLQLRLHHYIFGIVLMPATAFPTRASAVCQAFLLGLFLNGAAAFGLDSILQTAADLRRDAPLGSDLPSFMTNATNYNSSIPFLNQTIFWNAITDTDDGWDGFALLVDDVERYTGAALNFSLAALAEGIPHFFRLALQSQGVSGDFTKAATLWPNGTWVDPLPGPS
ncbi:LCCL domain-containing protein [Rickenella mellea]|uniref:LCCL domain-containing protein n=1 Tax=Rickenella mellea TaxID=50990 RepID=A0A4Y7QLR5_9AGAM|nr:LCCL domain-containing protein [Rickenella mellea]